MPDRLHRGESIGKPLGEAAFMEWVAVVTGRDVATRPPRTAEEGMEITDCHRSLRNLNRNLHRNLIFCLLSPTRAFAKMYKSGKIYDPLAHTIKSLNCHYFGCSIVFVISALLWDISSVVREYDILPYAKLMFGYYFLSRYVEIVYAFTGDAHDKLKLKKTETPQSKSSLTPWDRIVLAFRTYVELVLLFGIAYALFPDTAWGGDEVPKDMADYLTYSALTITTSGDGGFIPQHYALQLFTVAEIVSGILLLVVCFAVYTAHASVLSAEDSAADVTNPAADAPPPLKKLKNFCGSTIF